MTAHSRVISSSPCSSMVLPKPSSRIFWISWDRYSTYLTLRLILTEKDDETDEITAQFSHYNFTIVTGMGMKTAPEDGAKFFFLSVAQRSDSELLMERLERDNEDIQSALVELAGIIAEV